VNLKFSGNSADVTLVGVIVGGTLLHSTMRATVALVVVAAGLAPRSAAGGESISEEDLTLAGLLDTRPEVWSATRAPQNTYEAPAIVTTVTRDQILAWGYRSVAEVLGHALGFYVVDDHATTNVAVRGVSGGLYADSSIIKVLIDGHSVAFQSTGGNWLGPELVPLSAVERIEIVRGPASALFGADAFLGVVNIVTRGGRSLDGATAWVTGGRVGDHLAGDVDASAGFEARTLDVMASVRRTGEDLSGLTLPSSSPAPSIPAYNRGATRAQGLDQRATSALARVGWRPRAGTELGLFGYYSAADRGDEFGSLYQLARSDDNAPIYSANRVALHQLRAGITWDQSLGSKVQLSLHGSAFQGGPGADSRLEVGSEFYYVRRQYGFRGGDGDLQVDWSVRPALRVTGGASLLVDDELLPSRIGVAKQLINGSAPGDVIDSISVYQGRKTFRNAGAYLQGVWHAVDQLLGVTAGGRFDRHNIYGDQLSARVGLVSSPTETLHAKLLYGSAFKAPSPFLLYSVPSAIGDVTGNPQLKPQYVRTAEGQVAWQPVDLLELSSDVAYSVLTYKTEFVQQGLNDFARNVARDATLSWETAAELKVGSNLRARLSFETQRTLRRTGEEGYSAAVIGSGGGIYPRLMVHGGLVAQPPRWPVRAMVQASYIGSRRASDENILRNGGPYDLPPYLLLEAGLSTVGFHLFGAKTREVSFSVMGKNLLDSAGPAPGFRGVDYPLTPRSFFLQMNLTL
jgi:outer membrane receptor for ferrienterochelin and colicins